MGNPAAVVAISRVTGFVRANTTHGNFIFLRIILDRDQRRHTADGWRVTFVAGFQQQQRIRTHKWRSHRDFAAVRQTEVAVVFEFFDAGEDVIPATGIQTGTVFTQFVQDFIHFKRCDNRFNQHRGFDRALWQTQFVLRHHENVIPQTGFQMGFHFRQIEIRAGAACQLFFGIVEQEQREIENTAGNTFAIDQHMLFIQMPAARTYHQRSHFVIQHVAFAVLFQTDRAANGIAHIDLALNLVIPVRCIRIFKVRHVAVGTGIQRIDDHFALHRTSNFHAAAFQCFWQWCNRPVAFADMAGGFQEIRTFTGIHAFGALDAGLQQRLATLFKCAAQFCDKAQGFGGQNLFIARFDTGGNLYAFRQADCSHAVLHPFQSSKV